MILPVPGLIRTRATAVLRRPVPRKSEVFVVALIVLYKLTFKRDWVLCFMRMFLGGEQFKSFHHLARELVLWKHAFNSVLKNEVRAFFEHVFDIDSVFVATVTGVEHIFFVGHFFTGKLNLVGINDDNVVAAINVRCVNRFATTSKEVCYFYG